MATDSYGRQQRNSGSNHPQRIDTRRRFTVGGFVKSRPQSLGAFAPLRDAQHGDGEMLIDIRFTHAFRDVPFAVCLVEDAPLCSAGDQAAPEP